MWSATSASPVRDQIPVTRPLDNLAGGLLIACVTRDKPPQPTVRHVHEPGAIDPALGHPAPEVRGAEVRARLGHRIAASWLRKPFTRRRRRKAGLEYPAGIAVCRLDPRPLATSLAHSHRLPAEQLRDLLRARVRLDVDRSDLERRRANVEMVAQPTEPVVPLRADAWRSRRPPRRAAPG